MDLFSKSELLVMIIIVGVLLVVITYLTILDIKDYLKNRKDELEVDNFEENIEVESYVEENVVSVNPPVGSMTELLEEIEIIDFDEPEIKVEEVKVQENVTFSSNDSLNIIEVPMEVTQEEAKAELERVTMELENNANDPFEDTITNFELEQEENAIISLDELARVSDNLYDNNEVMQYDDGDEPITIDEVINKFSNTTSIEPIRVNDEEISYSNNMDDVSLMSNIYNFSNNDLEFENTANYDKFVKDQNNNDFLNSLKEMHEKHEN